MAGGEGVALVPQSGVRGWWRLRGEEGLGMKETEGRAGEVAGEKVQQK